MTVTNIVELMDKQGLVNIPTGWTQGRAVFGGLIAALMYRALEQCIGEPLPVRSLTVSFVAPAVAGDLLCEAEVLRRGKSVTQGQCRALQNGQVVAVLLASFGAARTSLVAVEPSLPPVFKAPDECFSLPFIEGMTPEFTRHYAFRWGHGAMPFSGADRADIGGWIRPQESDQPVSVAELLGLVDAWPPAVLPMLKVPAPASSLTWTIEFVGDIHSHTQGLPAGWWQYLAETEYAADGYVHTRARLWDQAGALVAISRQTVTVFA
ncbi:MAG: acyl-CoA thioesterase II [Gammaproteobacteria bacterium HGW-Gammaproteobacteria-14]|nr:MAG: acyl-CoA thioesterase II [Gammaproteobacteria bacterium HGW-Gammaproteobacteria-14]